MAVMGAVLPARSGVPVGPPCGRAGPSRWKPRATKARPRKRSACRQTLPSPTSSAPVFSIRRCATRARWTAVATAFAGRQIAGTIDLDVTDAFVGLAREAAEAVETARPMWAAHCDIR